MRVAGLIVVLLASTAHADPGDRWDGVMIAEQTGGGVVAGLTLGTGGAFAGAALASSKGSRDWGRGLLGAVIGGSIGAVAGTTIGVKVIGDARGGTGSWGATSVGGILGGVLTGLTLPLHVDKVPTAVSFGLASVTMLAPPILAYHLSTDENASTEKRVVVPFLLVSF